MLGKGLFGAGIHLYVHYEGRDARGVAWHEWVTIGEEELVLKPDTQTDDDLLPVKDALPLPELRTAIPSIHPQTVIIGYIEYVLGGIKDQSRLAYAIDLEPGSCSIPRWMRLPSMLGARYRPLTVVAEGKLYVLGGSLEEMSPIAEVYDPKVNTWMALEDPPAEHGRKVTAGACFYWPLAKKIVVSVRVYRGACILLMYDLIQLAWSQRVAPLCCGCKWAYASPQFALPSDSNTLFVMCSFEWHVFDLHHWTPLGPVMGLDEELKKLPGIMAVRYHSYKWPRMFLLGHNQHGFCEFGVLWMGLGDMISALYFAKVVVQAREGCFVGNVASLGGWRLLGRRACCPRPLLVHCGPPRSPCKRALESTQEQECTKKLPKQI